MPELPQDKTVQEGAYKLLGVCYIFIAVFIVHVHASSSVSSLRLPDHGPGIDIFTPGKPGEYDLEGGIWEDEDARNFYENLVDLKAFVPAILFKDNEKSGQAKDRDDGGAGSKGASQNWWLACTYPPPAFFLLTRHCRLTADAREAKDAVAEELELELEALDIADEPLELEGGDEAENEELAKKLLDEQGQ